MSKGMGDAREVAGVVKLLARDMEEFYVRVEAESRLAFLRRIEAVVDTLHFSYKEKTEQDADLEPLTVALELAQKIVKTRINKLLGSN